MSSQTIQKNKTGFIIQARTGSSRLPNKVLRNFYNGKNILNIIIEKLINHFNKYLIILATTNNPQDDKLKKFTEKYNIKIFRGSEENVLKRFIDAAQNYNLKEIIRVCADNPFLEIFYLKKLIDSYTKNYDYISYKIDQQPAICTHFGFFAEFVTLEALRKVTVNTNEKIYTEHVTKFIYTNPDLFNIKFLKGPEILKNRHDIRLTIDTIEDFKIAQIIFSELHKEKKEFSVSDIIKFLDKNPDLLIQMKANILSNRK